MTKSEREQKEYTGLFADERYAKKAWQSFFGKSLEGSAKAMPTVYDPKTGEPTFQSLLDQEAYKNVKARLEKEGLDREPMQAELIVECGILRSRFDNGMFNTVLERTAGKVKDEISVVKNPFEDLTDEELEMLAAARAAKSTESQENK